jgi:VanZ family protein
MRHFFEKSSITWLAVLFIAGFIFYMSSLTFGPGESVPNIATIFYHFFVFFWLGFFFSVVLVKGRVSSARFIMIAAIISLVYALSDEFHQLFVPSRSCSFFDFMVDSAGILSANLLYLFTLSIRRYRYSQQMVIGKLKESIKK